MSSYKCTVAEVVTWERGENAQITDNFSTREFECPCTKCVVQFITRELVIRLETMREVIGEPIYITNAYRCSVYQQKLRDRGYKTTVGPSTHEKGMAADIMCPQKKITELKKIALELFNAVGQGTTFLHVDVRDDKERFWLYS